MATVEKPLSGTMSELDYAVHLMTTGASDPEFAARVREKSARITEDVRKRLGTIDAAAALVRESRDDA